MEELELALHNLNDEEMLRFVLTVFWSVVIPIILVTLQVSNWIPFKNTWRNRKENIYGWFMLIFIVPFHTVSFICAMLIMEIIVHTIVRFVTYIF